MSFNTIISFDTCIISAWENANLHKFNMTLNSNFLVIEILITGYMSCEYTVDQPSEKYILKPLLISNCQEKVANTRHNSDLKGGGGGGVH